MSVWTNLRDRIERWHENVPRTPCKLHLVVSAKPVEPPPSLTSEGDDSDYKPPPAVTCQFGPYAPTNGLNAFNHGGSGVPGGTTVRTPLNPGLQNQVNAGRRGNITP